MIISCVRVGKKYGPEYVARLRAMVKRHLPFFHRFVVITDQDDEIEGVERIDIRDFGLQGWWAKMFLFRTCWRRNHKMIYFDLDTVIVNDITRLTCLPFTFITCANFARAAGAANWPCKYGSCIMSMTPSFGDDIWQGYWERREQHEERLKRFGDQKLVEELAPHAELFQDHLPKGFFMTYRDLPKMPGPEASVLIFGGQRKPHNCDVPWVKSAWTEAA